MTDVSLIIIQYGDPELLFNLFNSLESHPDRGLISEFIIVDNGGNLSKEEGEKIMEKNFSTRIVTNPENSYASGVNKGVRSADGDLLLISNNDVEWIEGHSIGPVLAQLSRSSVGIVGPQQVYPDGSWQRSYGKFPSIWEAFASLLFIDSVRNLILSIEFNQNIYRTIQPEYVDGAFMCIDRDCFESIGGFDESFEFYAEDTTFCREAQNNGWTVLTDTRAQIMHVRGASSSMEQTAAYEARLLNSKRQHVQRYSGPIRSLLFAVLISISALVRVILYSLFDQIFDQRWSNRAETAKAKFRGTIAGLLESL